MRVSVGRSRWYHVTGVQSRHRSAEHATHGAPHLLERFENLEDPFAGLMAEWELGTLLHVCRITPTWRRSRACGSDLEGGMSGRFGIVAVTGGAQGIGRALCEAFAADGATKVFVLDKNKALAEAVAQFIGGRAFAVDATDAAAFEAVLERQHNGCSRNRRDDGCDIPPTTAPASRRGAA